jgi:uncharacterized protein YbaP (TraB family)
LFIFEQNLIKHMIRKYWLLFSVTLLLAACGIVRPKQSDSEKYTGLENALLWKISGPEINESYLFGTIHIIDSERFFYPEGLLSGLEQSEKVFFEVDMEQMNDIGFQMEMMQKATMKGDVSLSDLISEEDYELIRAHFQKMGIPLMMFERLKPMFLTVFAGDMDPQGLQTGTMKSYEMELQKLAKEAKKPSGGLESIDYQLAVLDSIPYADQAQMLVDAIKQASDESDYLDKMIDVYTSQNLNEMVSMFTEEDNEIEGFEDILLVNRNRNWIPVMMNEMKAQPSFFAVGAGHLGGPEGVIHLLRSEGITVSPVNPVE